MKKFATVLLAAMIFAVMCGVAWAAYSDITTPMWDTNSSWINGDWEIEIDVPFDKIKEISIDDYKEDQSSAAGWKLILTDADSVAGASSTIASNDATAEIARAVASTNGSKITFKEQLVKHIYSKTEKTGYDAWGVATYGPSKTTINILATDGALSVARLMYYVAPGLGGGSAAVAEPEYKKIKFSFDAASWTKRSSEGLTMRTNIPKSEFDNGNYVIGVDRLIVLSPDCRVSTWVNRLQEADSVSYDATLITLRPSFLEDLFVGRHYAALVDRDIDNYWKEHNADPIKYPLATFTTRDPGSDTPVVPNVTEQDKQVFDSNVSDDLGDLFSGPTIAISDDVDQNSVYTASEDAFPTSSGYDDAFRNSLESVFAIRHPIAQGGHIKVGSKTHLAPHIKSPADRRAFSNSYNVRKYFEPGVYIDLLAIDGAITYSQVDGLRIAPMIVVINDVAPQASSLPKESQARYHTRGTRGQYGLLMGKNGSVMYIWDGTPDAYACDPFGVSTKDKSSSGGACSAGASVLTALAALALIRRRAA